MAGLARYALTTKSITPNPGLLEQCNAFHSGPPAPWRDSWPSRSLPIRSLPMTLSMALHTCVWLTAASSFSRTFRGFAAFVSARGHTTVPACGPRGLINFGVVRQHATHTSLRDKNAACYSRFTPCGATNAV